MKSEKRVLFLLAASAVVILLVTVLTLFSGKEEPAGTKKPGKDPRVTAGAKVTGGITAEHNKLMMVKSVDTAESTIAVYDLEDGGEVMLSYDVAADIRSKYGSLTYAAALTYGQIVRAEYDGEGRLVKMQLSGEHWELHGVEEFSITNSTLTVNNTTYKLTEETVAYCEGEKIALGEVRDIDRVELCGIDSEILTVRVVKGHGSIKLVNCTEFQGAKVTFKDESHVLEGEPTYLVREGKYTVSVVGEKNAAAAEVTVARNEQVVIDLYEYGGAPVETAQVRFKVTPFSAVLTIDGERVDYYEQDLVLEYGEHEVVAELGGYTTYKGILAITRPYHTFQIDLPERPVTDQDPEEEDSGDENDGEDDSIGSESGDGPQEGNDSSSTENPEGDTSEDDSGEGSGDDSGSGAGESGSGAGDGDETADRRYVPIGAAGGYDYDKEYSTFLLEPTGAIVLIDGISLGAAPVEFEKILGTYTITLRKNGKEKEYTVTVDEGSFEGDVYWKFSMN
ncbi:MAG: PEGA domain-containing protein [Lachnospiraceae bacterium]|nr:PEGA domain-containing protein [Lachnospiraceae bacterium]